MSITATDERRDRVMPDTTAYIAQLIEKRDELILALQSRPLPARLHDIPNLISYDVQDVIDTLIAQEGSAS